MEESSELLHHNYCGAVEGGNSIFKNWYKSTAAENTKKRSLQKELKKADAQPPEE